MNIETIEPLKKSYDKANVELSISQTSEHKTFYRKSVSQEHLGG